LPDKPTLPPAQPDEGYTGLEGWTEAGMIERMTDLGGFVIPGEPAGLGTWEGTQNVLRQLGGRLVEARAAFAEGQIGEAELERRVDTALDDAEDAFLGRRIDLSPTFWNAPEQVGRYLKRTLGLAEPEDKAVRRVLEAFFAEIATVVVDHESGALSDDDMPAAVDGLIETYAYHFLGMPLENGVE
jgi:hypothetical protein